MEEKKDEAGSQLKAANGLERLPPLLATTLSHGDVDDPTGLRASGMGTAGAVARFGGLFGSR